MPIHVMHPDSFQTSDWSGGKTSELFIYPEAANYKERNFNFRLSTATVEVEASDFTPLSGISRTLMVLEGKMTLYHEGHHSSVLQPGDMDVFEGAWKTRSIGQCVDFNLMTTLGTEGELEYLELTKGETVHSANSPLPFRAFYVHKGKVELQDATKHYSVGQGELAIASQHTDALSLVAMKDSSVVEVRITRLPEK